MKTVTSRDGTTIAYEQIGSGPPVVLVDGALCRRTFGPMLDLAPLLADRFTVVYYDRRGRGDSGDSPPYAVEREVEDLRALIDSSGGSAFLFGTSSGAALAARAAASGARVAKLVLHEPPYVLDSEPQPPEGYRARIAEMLAADRRGAAVATFMKVVGVPAFGVLMMRLMRGIWSKLKASAHTLPYDFAVLGDTPGRPLPGEVTVLLGSIQSPTLLLLGGKSPPWMRRAVETVAKAIPGAQLRVLPGQQHNVAAKAVAPVLVEFFS